MMFGNIALEMGKPKERGVSLQEIIDVRFHGRGGQGVVTASRLLAEAALSEGKRIQSFPSFGAEREGAPIRAFTRISEKPITIHSQIYNPDIVVVLDPTLLRAENVTEGLKDKGWLIVNTSSSPSEVKNALNANVRTATVDATKIALEVLGAPRVNAPMLGALVKATKIVNLDSILQVIGKAFRKEVAEKNVQAVRRAYQEVVEG
nr:pyruvate ferredoxin oxidoreductase subunit gamma [Candidatus Freyrarchaeum guaymaensis]